MEHFILLEEMTVALSSVLMEPPALPGASLLSSPTALLDSVPAARPVPLHDLLKLNVADAFCAQRERA